MKKSWCCPAFRVIFFCLLFWQHKPTLCKWIWRNVAAKGSQHRFAQVASYCWRSLTSYSLNSTSMLIRGDKGSELRKPPSSKFTCQGEDNQMACQSICISRRWGGAVLSPHDIFFFWTYRHLIVPPPSMEWRKWSWRSGSWQYTERLSLRLFFFNFEISKSASFLSDYHVFNVF